LLTAHWLTCVSIPAREGIFLFSTAAERILGPQGKAFFPSALLQRGFWGLFNFLFCPYRKKKRLELNVII
jgi:hypothetical protein